MARLAPFLLVGAGGFIGCNLRYLVNLWIAGQSFSRFPLATFLVNVTGSFLLGFVAALVAERLIPFPESFRLLLGVGLLGGYTTFSTYELETDAMLRQGDVLYAALYFCASPLLGFLALRLGLMAAQLLRA